MKNLIIAYLLAYATPLIAQHKLINVDSLIKNKKFVFVTTEIEKKPGFNGSYGFSKPNGAAYNVNPAVMTIRQSFNITSREPGSTGSHIQEEYYRLSELDGSYFTAYNIAIDKKKEISTNGFSLFLIQDTNNLALSNLLNPSSINAIKKSEFFGLGRESYETEYNRKNSGTWLITYKIKDENKRHTFYLEVKQNGIATLTQEPEKEYTTILTGFVAPLR